jgi:hypothetical protein
MISWVNKGRSFPCVPFERNSGWTGHVTAAIMQLATALPACGYCGGSRTCIQSGCRSSPVRIACATKGLRRDTPDPQAESLCRSEIGPDTLKTLELEMSVIKGPNPSHPATVAPWPTNPAKGIDEPTDRLDYGE